MIQATVIKAQELRTKENEQLAKMIAHYVGERLFGK